MTKHYEPRARRFAPPKAHMGPTRYIAMPIPETPATEQSDDAALDELWVTLARKERYHG